MTSRRALLIAALLLALATICGALGVHGLKARLTPERLEIWNIAVRWHFLQGLGLLAVGLALRTLEGPAVRAAALLIASGIVLFCGSLYALSLGAPAALGALTPLGGLAWIAGWLSFAWGIWRHRA